MYWRMWALRAVIQPSCDPEAVTERPCRHLYHSTNAEIKIYQHFAFIAGLWYHIAQVSKRSMQHVIQAGGATLGMLNARKVTRSKYEHVSACSLQCINTQRRYTYITNVRHVIYVLLDAIFVRFIHWFAPVDIDQPSIGCGSSGFAAKKTPEERPALAMCYTHTHVYVA
jgi:hypothetical protein